MFTKLRILGVLPGILGYLFLSAPPVQPAGQRQLGRILNSNATTLRGLAVPSSGTVLNGDVLSTYSDGNAVVELKLGAKLTLRENTSVRFILSGEKVQADLIAGGVESESVGRPALVVTTSNYHFAPSHDGDCRFAVALTKRRDTVAGAIRGNLLVTTPDSLASYILPEGEYAAIPASSVGVPPQEKPSAESMPPEQAGTVRNAVPEEVLQRRGEAGALPLQVQENVNVGDVVRTLKTGRVRLELLNGSFLNLGARSVARIVHQDAVAQRTQVELTLGLMRAEVAKFSKPDASFEIRTMTAKISVTGTIVLVHALTNLTEVYCLQGACSVQNIDPSIPGAVTLHDGDSTSVPGGLGPTAPVQTPTPELQSQVKQTDVGTSTVEVSATGENPGEAPRAAGEPWHIGSLSEGTSLLLLLGIGGGAAAAAAIAASSGGHGGGGTPSPSAP